MFCFRGELLIILIRKGLRGLFETKEITDIISLIFSSIGIRILGLKFSDRVVY